MASTSNIGLFDHMVAQAVPLVPGPIVRRLGAPYVGGITLDEALSLIADLHRRQFETSVDVLGESVDDCNGAIAAADAYLAALDALAARGLPAHVSLKRSGLGSELSREIAGEQIERVVQRAEELDAFVCIDMEDATTIDATLSLYRDLRNAGHERLGIVLQARLWRTASDVETLADLKPNVRLCKGIYLEPPHIGMQDRDAIRRNYSRLLRRLLANGSFVAVATHDEQLVVDALEAFETLGIGCDAYEFQTLLGVRTDLAKLLARDHSVRVYVPYGPESYAYAQRRLRKNPQIAGYVARNTLRGMARAVRH
jgi:proline dehydrogenase